MSMLVKLSVGGISVCGVAVGAGFGIHHLTKASTKEEKQESIQTPSPSSSKAITEWLNEESRVVLIAQGETDNASWGTVWIKFKEEYASKNLQQNWGSLESKKAESTVPSEFKALCKSNSEQQVKDNKAMLYVEVKSYCTKAKDAS